MEALLSPCAISFYINKIIKYERRLKAFRGLYIKCLCGFGSNSAGSTRGEVSIFVPNFLQIWPGT